LGIYSLILLPSVKGMINLEVVDVFKSIVTFKVNPATSVLYKTF
jgi:hypothetical protein